eukprot:TRINITY_DN3796_c0_g3_i1.p1 TRINITY_DN3796_c0_g3~~TRINITY_DN3796_c0_g3_i1.p1  ORF type:complete len:296 (-),score=18.18 TRINITY_DN3796_c0_g3_i1:1125-1940(-)
MGCNESVTVLPLPVQKAIRSKHDTKSFILSMNQFDQNYDWYCNTCRQLEGSSIHSLTLNFDSNATIPRTLSSSLAETEAAVISALLRLLNSLRLDELVLTGHLDIFSNERWKEYWTSCGVKTVSVQDRLKTRGFVNLMKSHAENVSTTCLILKRELTLNDLFYLYRYLLRNETLQELQLVLTNQANRESSDSFFLNAGKAKQPQILVSADRMELVGTLCQPLGLLANSRTLKCICLDKSRLATEWLHGQRNRCLLNQRTGAQCGNKCSIAG